MCRMDLDQGRGDEGPAAGVKEMSLESGKITAGVRGEGRV